MTKAAAKKSNKTTSSPVVKYHTTANTSEEHEVLIDDLFNRDKHRVSAEEKAFDFTSINQYESIFKYGTKNSLRRHNEYSVNGETKRLDGIEKFIYYSIIGFFYLLFVALLPISLIFCLKKVNENESVVVYRLGRLVSPAYKPGYCVLFPFIDEYKKHAIVPKEFFLPNLQIINYENAIIDISTRIRYVINDVLKMTNSVQDLSVSIKSITRGTLVNLLSKKDASKIEREKNYFTQDIKNSLNESIRKWGVEIIELELTINSIAKDESEEATENPAFKSISMVIKSLFNNSSSSSSDPKPGTSSSSGEPSAATGGLDPTLFAMLQGMTPMVVPPAAGDASTSPSTAAPKDASGFNFMSLFMPNVEEETVNQPPKTTANEAENQSEFSPYKILKLVEPLLNESLVNDIQTVYEFQIRLDSLNHDKNYQESKCEVFHLDLKNAPKGMIGRGPYLFSKADCIIRLNDQDLAELMTDKLKPFTAYMSGRIEIDGDLQDVFKLKKLIKSVSTIAGIKTAK